jgi:hypothetical protein
LGGSIRSSSAIALNNYRFYEWARITEGISTMIERTQSTQEPVELGTRPLSEFEISVQSPNFYREKVLNLLSVCGNEQRYPNMNYAVDILNQDLDLDLHPVRAQTYKILLHELLNADRFRGHVFIEAELGENSAVHSCHTAILINEIFRRAGLFDGENLIPEMTRLRRDATEACLIHDMGEILGEFNTLTQRIADSSLSEDADIERKVFSTALRLALFATEGSQRGDTSPLVAFFRELRSLRDTAKIDDHTGNQASQGIVEILKRYAGPEYQLNARLRQHEAHFMRLFDITELRESADISESERFLGNLIKTVEHTQGTRHLTRFAHKSKDYHRVDLLSPRSGEQMTEIEGTNAISRELTLPYSLCSSAVVLGVGRYMESSVGEMFRYAVAPHEVALARAGRDACYLSLVESFTTTAPLVDRTKNQISSIVRRLMNEATNPSASFVERSANLGALQCILEEDQREALEQARSEKRSDPNYQEEREHRLYDIETRGRLMSLYLKAIEVDYRPKPGEVLLERKELPPELTPLPKLTPDWWNNPTMS